MSVSNANEPLSYRLHGTTLGTPLELPCALARGLPEWQHGGAEGFSPAPTDAEELAFLRLGEVGYHACRVGSRVWIRFFGQVEFLLNQQTKEISHLLCRAGDPRLLEQFLPNAVLALGLGMHGVPLLHASAVQLNGVALGIAGPSRAGKSSLAAALCASGATLVTDDTLRISPTATEPTCFSGTTRLRLRQRSEQLAGCLPEPSVRTSDSRLGITLPQPTNDLPIRGLWFPQLIQSSAQLDAVPLSGHDRLISLFSNVRLAGWSPLMMAGLMPQLRGIADRMSCYRLLLPEGLIFTESGRQQVHALARECVVSQVAR